MVCVNAHQMDYHHQRVKREETECEVLVYEVHL